MKHGLNIRFSARVAALSALALAAVWACSVTRHGLTSGAAQVSANGAGGMTASQGHGGGLFSNSSAGGDNNPNLTIKPANPVITFPGAMTTVAFEADELGQKVSPTWSVDQVQLGGIDANGLFSASGTVGGTATVTATYGMATATTTVSVQLTLSDNPGNLTPAQIATLKAGGASDSAFRWLYPYDRTVWPRGLDAPLMQFGGAPADAVWLHVETKSKTLVYDGYYGNSDPTRVTPSAAVWKTITGTAGAAEPVTISATKLSLGAATGPKTETWSVAQGTLKGTVYYDSYDLNGQTGNVFKLKPGTQAQILEGGNGKCVVCHTVAGNGSVMFAAHNGYSTGGRYDLANNGSESPMTRNDHVYDFPAVYPDGSLVLSTSAQHIGGMWTGEASGLYDTNTGQQLTAPGFDGVVQHAGCPTFSGDGKKLAFNWEDMGQMHSLAVMSFDVKTHAFSNATTLVTNPTAFLGWPSFTPDAKALLYDQNDSQVEATSPEPEPNYGTWFGYRANLAIVDIASKTVTQLDLLNGMSKGQVYLPYGQDDYQRNFEPNVAPLPVGGYVWVVFTSRRQFGNTFNEPLTNGYGQDDSRKKLWIAAIDANPKPGTDPSHPAIYLPGQLDTRGNMRAFWVFDPCKQNGNSCGSGDECCTGFCRDVNGMDTCVPPPNGCSMEFEKCTTTSDCCDAPKGIQCINGFCVTPNPK